MTKIPRFEYPKVRRDEAIADDYHGVEIKDPYRWLEDPDSEETKKFVDDQNKLFQSFLSQCEYKEKIRERITELWNYPKYGCPFKSGDNYYFFKNSGLQNQSVLYIQEALDAEPKEFLDPNKFAEDGTTALQSYSFSEDGKLFAYMMCEKGSDWGKIKFKSVETGQDYDEVLENVKFSCLCWTHDNKGVFYNRYPSSLKVDGTATEKNEFQELHYHVVGTSQDEDILVARFPEEPNWMGHAEVSDCGNYLMLMISKSCDPVNQLWYCDLRKTDHKISTDLEFVKLIDNFEAKYRYVTNDGPVFTFKTDLNAPNNKLINYDLSESEPKAVELLAEDTRPLLGVSCVDQNKLVIRYMNHCKEELYLLDLKTGKQLKNFNLDIGTILELNGEKKHDFFFYKFGSFTSPGDIYQFKFTSDQELEKLEPVLYRKSEFNGLDLSSFKTEQLFFESKDGTKIPMFLVSKKNLAKSENNPVYMYGYGGFNVSLTPTFSIVRLIWLQHFNGTYVSVNLRGGGEYGMSWYNAGRLFNKQNVFDDFISAASYLIENKYTSSDKLAINGGSNGGLLVTAVINQKPELFRAAVADVSVTDMLRFHQFTIGSYWVSDYGCSDKKKDFDYMIKYSPLHTINSGKEYPYVLLVTADHDDRVVPAHSYKYIAELQHVNGTQEKPFLIRIETKAGHGAGKPTTKIIEEYADKYAYLSHVMGLKYIE